jgi:GAF domain-containing protein
MAAASGERQLLAPDDHEREPGEEHLTALVPLALGGKVFGVLAVFRLLPQKPGFEEVDLELFDLLGSQAAVALYSTALHARLAARDGTA